MKRIWKVDLETNQFVTEQSGKGISTKLIPLKLTNVISSKKKLEKSSDLDTSKIKDAIEISAKSDEPNELQVRHPESISVTVNQTPKFHSGVNSLDKIESRESINSNKNLAQRKILKTVTINKYKCKSDEITTKNISQIKPSQQCKNNEEKIHNYIIGVNEETQRQVYVQSSKVLPGLKPLKYDISKTPYDNWKTVYLCDVCAEEFNDKAALEEHRRCHVEKNHFVCDICDEIFPRKTTLNKHRKEHKTFLCDLCAMQFTRESALEKHRQCHPENGGLQCKICEEFFPGKVSLNFHLKENHKDYTRYKCEMCDETFSLKLHYDKHQKCHAEKIQHQCEICGRQFIRKFNFETHMQRHMKGMGSQCDICGKIFTRHHNMLRHREYVHIGDRPFECNICFKAFKNKHAYNHHRLIHDKPKAQKGPRITPQCEFCAEVFASHADLSKHKVIHSDLMNLQCEFCDEKFCSKPTFLHHRSKYHTGQKPFKCDICNKGFAVRTFLQVHMKIHTNEKPYTCEICGLKCRRKYNLKRHLFLHTGVKPFQCEFCQRKFAQKPDYKKHRLIHIRKGDPLELQQVDSTGPLLPENDGSIPEIIISNI